VFFLFGSLFLSIFLLFVPYVFLGSLFFLPLFLWRSIFIGNVLGTPFVHDFSLDKHGWEGGVGFLLGLGHLRFDPYLLG